MLVHAMKINDPKFPGRFGWFWYCLICGIVLIITGYEKVKKLITKKAP